MAYRWMTIKTQSHMNPGQNYLKLLTAYIVQLIMAKDTIIIIIITDWLYRKFIIYDLSWHVKNSALSSTNK